MAYEIDLAEPLDAELRRVAREQVARALAALGDVDGASGIHNARKRLKRLRSLLRLLRQALGQTYALENRRFRDIARSMSGPRDARVLAETAAGLAAHAGERADAMRPVVDAADAAYLDLVGGHGERAPANGAAAALDEALGGLGNWPIDGIERKVLIDAVERSYSGGRKAWADARTAAMPEAFHEWRKHVQHHWHHMRLMRNLWPDAMRARENTARRLSDVLGRDHDLATLSDALENGVVACRGKSRKTVLKLARRRQEHIRSEAEAIARRLYAEKPAAFTGRIDAYWRAADPMTKR